MKAMFSPSTLSFYPQNMIDDESYENLPADLIEVTDEELSTYWKQSAPTGKQLGTASGRPSWVNLPPPTYEELFAIANAKKSQLKAVADSEINWRQDAVDGAYAEANEVTELSAWKKYRVLLMRVDTSKAPDIEWPVAPA
ncbi:TPA: tail fiber assembly protein [Yersinia enterocolitica]|uniref:tail fiber assembly protein n=1 Tax=Yersinia enterocolitica TaxID=630 RepID=UPI0021E7A7BC|nr:tail fiber assembly protein [Yersinia enterocolitica]UYJ83768.1 tail fiber assembly protein [Yersinia enterocolitica]UYK13146.1 tail fiber assembly protein [Yersinia enterocolitica]HDL7926882.1 tail fiber assembly protein [Yersinia enterocolitica]HDL7933093.1 tail fiber assembly protein [Yersinia enterocolitica]HDY4895990.1 tail fiber assembly protein [Yersinia enterocolitica]